MGMEYDYGYERPTEQAKGTQNTGEEVRDRPLWKNSLREIYRQTGSEGVKERNCQRLENWRVWMNFSLTLMSVMVRGQN